MVQKYVPLVLFPPHRLARLTLMTVGTYKMRIWGIKQWHDVQAVVGGKWPSVSEFEM
jgi:hypothetical protein